MKINLVPNKRIENILQSKKETSSNPKHSSTIQPLNQISINKTVLSQLVPFVGQKQIINQPEKLSESYIKNKFIGFNQKILDKTKLYEFQINLKHPKIRSIFSDIKNQIKRIDSNEEKIELIKTYVDNLFSKESNEERLAKTRHYIELFKKTGISKDFGSLVERGAGVCRHRSVLFKLICDNVFDSDDVHRPKASLVAGKHGGPHAWNVVKYLDNDNTPRSKIIDYSYSFFIDDYENKGDDYKNALEYETMNNSVKEHFSKTYYNGRK
jgi:hypothetical protein